MDTSETKDLCLSLMNADTEDKVIELLTASGYWDSNKSWRCLGDMENNYSVIGSQQSRADAALVEKLVNSIDARLMDECARTGIDPEGELAPPDIRHAVAQLVEKHPKPEIETSGRISEWTPAERTVFARDITVAATGSRHQPSFTIADSGEGQTPNSIPDTLLSLNKSNKLKIPFVQGKFNMGGTGVLRFCGNHSLQLVLSRRDPAIVNKSNPDPSDTLWSFTVVRREEPKGTERSSVFRYLAPLNCQSSPGKGGVLRFNSETFPIFPETNSAYAREAEWGTLIKLYEYNATGFRSHMLLPNGLLNKVDLLLPEPALPIRFHECRDYVGHTGSFDTTLTGVGVRLSDDKAENMESGFPSFCPINIDGQVLHATIYAFKKGKAKTYRRNEGIIFVLNGQTHASIDTNFFRTGKVGLGYIADSLLIKVECNNLNGRSIEDLFMNSRDRLSNDSELKQKIMPALASMLKAHTALRELKNRRREEEISEKLQNNKPLAETLEAILKQSPTLSQLFLPGARISNPFKNKNVTDETSEFLGEKFPTYFRFKGLEYGKILKRECNINRSCRITLETDAENEYFARKESPGEASISIGTSIPLQDYVGPNPNNGLASLTFELPQDVNVGDTIALNITVTDTSRTEPFINHAEIKILPEAKKQKSTGGRGKPPSDKDGNKRDIPSKLSLPEIYPVSESDWKNYDPEFDKHTALRIVSKGPEVDNGNIENKHSHYDFYINEDNIDLKSELKTSGNEEKLVKSQFTYGMVLSGLALLYHQSKNNNSDDDLPTFDGNPQSIEEKVAEFSSALSPFIVPMINALGLIEFDDDFVESPSEQAA